MRLKIKNDTSYVKDASTGAVINTNNNDLQAYRQKRNNNREFAKLKDTCNTLQNDVEEIKQMLQILIQGKDR